ncbi:excreted virulence factor EspC (type VII ESX diderm) [Lentzea atacamensis]|uniref:Excreted virulence factor EspC (Type VII ESX diderm) n=1 Tax=Lentzea atacamensis TaxID=531938 RepID=A0ABX9E8K2_9PSEU|nr:type VII secretion target [Lentzea atacamensis]RAS64099.1 excreted virulence factor EspC (type VII ESX diderm) [Lentzea atacamensis]
MQQHFNIDIDELRTHAANVDRLTDRLRKATETCDPGALTTEAFGVFCGFLAQYVLQQAGLGQDGLGKAANSLMDMAIGLKETVEQYEQVDLDNMFGFKGGRG